MTDRSVTYLLIGGGLAAANCARHLRDQGADGSIFLVGREPELPYNRPPLSKGYVRGEESREKILVRPASWYEENSVEVLTGVSVDGLDAHQKVATLSNGENVRFEKALLATGSDARQLPVEGADLEGIHTLRTLKDSNALRAELESAERVAIVGGSFIGTELAASFTALGKACELIMIEAAPLELFFGHEVGEFFGGTLRDHGIAVHGSQELARFEGSDGRVRRLVTKSGLEVECDFVVIGAGVTPQISLAETAGLATARGVLTNTYLETSAPGIFAAGDIAEYESVIHDRRMRIEHWDVAFNQGKTAALNMLGKRQAHDVVPYFWSDLADWSSMEYVGPALDWDEIWWRGSTEEGKFTAWYVKDRRLAGALTVGRSSDIGIAGRLMTEKTDIGDRRVAFEDADGDPSLMEDTATESR